MTEELLLKALKLLGEAFAEGIVDGLRDRGFLQAASTDALRDAAPARGEIHARAGGVAGPAVHAEADAGERRARRRRPPDAALSKRLTGSAARISRISGRRVAGPDRLARESDGKADAIFL